MKGPHRTTRFRPRSEIACKDRMTSRPRSSQAVDGPRRRRPFRVDRRILIGHLSETRGAEDADLPADHRRARDNGVIDGVPQFANVACPFPLFDCRQKLVSNRGSACLHMTADEVLDQRLQIFTMRSQRRQFEREHFPVGDKGLREMFLSAIIASRSRLVAARSLAFVVRSSLDPTLEQ